MTQVFASLDGRCACDGVLSVPEERFGPRMAGMDDQAGHGGEASRYSTIATTR